MRRATALLLGLIWGLPTAGAQELRRATVWDLPREISRWAGTTEAGFPVVVSALFDDNGVLKGFRLVTDSRPEHRTDIADANLRKRADGYLLGGLMAARHGIEVARDCVSLPA